MGLFGQIKNKFGRNYIYSEITPNRTFCLNHNEFVNSLEDIIEDSNFEEDNEAEDLAEESQEKNNNDITWDPALK